MKLQYFQIIIIVTIWIVGCEKAPESRVTPSGAHASTDQGNAKQIAKRELSNDKISSDGDPDKVNALILAYTNQMEKFKALAEGNESPSRIQEALKVDWTINMDQLKLSGGSRTRFDEGIYESPHDPFGSLLDFIQNQHGNDPAYRVIAMSLTHLLIVSSEFDHKFIVAEFEKASSSESIAGDISMVAFVGASDSLGGKKLLTFKGLESLLTSGDGFNQYIALSLLQVPDIFEIDSDETEIVSMLLDSVTVKSEYGRGFLDSIKRRLN